MFNDLFYFLSCISNAAYVYDDAPHKSRVKRKRDLFPGSWLKKHKIFS